MDYRQIEVVRVYTCMCCGKKHYVESKLSADFAEDLIADLPEGMVVRHERSIVWNLNTVCENCVKINKIDHFDNTYINAMVSQIF